MKLRAHFREILQISRTTSPAMISPATDGTNATLPGVLRLPGAALKARDPKKLLESAK